MTKFLVCDKVVFEAFNYAVMGDKDDPYGLAPIRVTEAESNPPVTTPEASAVRVTLTRNGGRYVYTSQCCEGVHWGFILKPSSKLGFLLPEPSAMAVFYFEETMTFTDEHYEYPWQWETFTGEIDEVSANRMG